MKTLFTDKQLAITLQRLARELVERHDDFSESILIGIQPRGIYLADRIHSLVKEMLPDCKVDFGKMDITFYRDDIYSKNSLMLPTATDIPFEIDEKKIVLIDDVLFTGRTIRSAMDALVDYGRPKLVELMVLIDRRFSRELPIQPDYTGLPVDSVGDQKVKVRWKEREGKDEVVMV